MREFLERLLLRLQEALPQRWLTAQVHRLMRSEIRWLKNTLITVIGSAAGVDWLEAPSTELDDYPSFNAFFTRALKPGTRPLDPDPRCLVCPCDGRISELGSLSGVELLQAKGRYFSVGDLLAGDEAAPAFSDGLFCTVYHSPRDYHRVHMPCDGELRRMVYVPGDLFSVAPYTVRQVPGLFARNERVVSLFDTRFGPMGLVLVGAMLVAGMDTVWAGTVTPAGNRKVAVYRYGPGEVALRRGDEMGRFNMGSTVILLLPPRTAALHPDLQPGQVIRMGTRLASLAADTPGTPA